MRPANERTEVVFTNVRMTRYEYGPTTKHRYMIRPNMVVLDAHPDDIRVWVERGMVRMATDQDRITKKGHFCFGEPPGVG